MIDPSVMWWGIADRENGFIVEQAWSAGDTYQLPLLFRTRREARDYRKCNRNNKRYIVVRIWMSISQTP